MFFQLRKLTHIVQSSSKNQTNEKSYKTKSEDKIFNSINVLELIPIRNSSLLDYLLIDYPILKNFLLLLLQYTKNNIIKPIF